MTVDGLGGADLLTIISIIFRAATKVNLLPVPYKDFNPLQVDLIAGRLDSYFGIFTVYGPHAAAGRVSFLSVTRAKRSAVLPDVPTIAEARVPTLHAYGPCC